MRTEGYSFYLRKIQGTQLFEKLTYLTGGFLKVHVSHFFPEFTPKKGQQQAPDIVGNLCNFNFERKRIFRITGIMTNETAFEIMSAKKNSVVFSMILFQLILRGTASGGHYIKKVDKMG